MNDIALDADLILRHIQDGLLIVDTEGRILFTNDSFREMIGRGDEDLLGRRCCELGVGAFCKDHCPVTAEEEAACTDGTRLDVEIDGRDGRGRPGPYCLVMSRVRDDGGNVIGWFESFREAARAIDPIASLEGRPASPSVPRGRRKTPSEAEGLLRALEANRWSAARTAQDLGISRTTLWRKMKRFGIDRKA